MTVTSVRGGIRLWEPVHYVNAGHPERAATNAEFDDLQRTWLRSLRVEDGRCNLAGIEGDLMWRLRREAPAESWTRFVLNDQTTSMRTAAPRPTSVVLVACLL